MDGLSEDVRFQCLIVLYVEYRVGHVPLLLRSGGFGRVLADLANDLLNAAVCDIPKPGGGLK